MTDLPELPPQLALAWGVAERPERVPRRELSIERIVEAAVEIADVEGIGGVSMARVAKSLGFTTMSLYRYVTSKDDLLLLMQEAAMDDDLPPAHEPADWRAELREWILHILDLYRRRPWVLDIPVTGVPMTPANLRFVDTALRALRSTPLDDEEKMGVLMLASGYARTAGTLERDLTRAMAESGGGDAVTGAGFADTLRELVDEVRFPYLRPLVERGSYAGEGDLDDATWGLERTLDGIEAYIDAGAAGAPSAGRDGTAGTAAAGPAPVDPVVAEAVALIDAYGSDPKVKKAAAKRKEADKRVREAQKKVRELEKAAREARKAEALAARAAVDRGRAAE